MRTAASRGNELLGLPWLHRRHSQAQEAPQPKAMALGPGCRWELVTLENTSIYKTVSSSKHFMEPWRPGHAPPLGQTAAKHFLLVVVAFQWEPGDVTCCAQLCRLRGRHSQREVALEPCRTAGRGHQTPGLLGGMGLAVSSLTSTACNPISAAARQPAQTHCSVPATHLQRRAPPASLSSLYSSAGKSSPGPGPRTRTEAVRFCPPAPTGALQASDGFSFPRATPAEHWGSGPRPQALPQDPSPSPQFCWAMPAGWLLTVGAVPRAGSGGKGWRCGELPGGADRVVGCETTEVAG